MKKVLALFVVVMLATVGAMAQVESNALGLRLGGGDGFGTEISYQHGLSSSTRLEGDLGFFSSDKYNRMRITGIHQWVWAIQGSLNWYAGVGAAVGHESNRYDSSNSFILDAVGNIGLEYKLDIPLQLTLDFRPAFGISQFGGSSLGLGVRYTF